MNGKVLLMVDDPAVCRMLVRVLVEEGFSVSAARNGREAFTFAAGNKFDLLLLDVDLPGDEGSNLCRQFAAISPALPIIIMRAPTQAMPSSASGVGVCLEKPLDIDHLLRVMAELLGRPESAATVPAGATST